MPGLVTNYGSLRVFGSTMVPDFSATVVSFSSVCSLSKPIYYLKMGTATALQHCVHDWNRMPTGAAAKRATAEHSVF
jgi:hypothetical protein